MGTPTLLTYYDAIEHLITWSGAMPQESEHRAIRTAIQAAYREVALDTDWAYFTKQHRITLDAEYTTGTVSSSSGTVTLSDGTWPSWARYGRITFGTDSVVYKVAERTSDSVVTLESDFSPADDVTAGTSYTLYRTVYPLPADLQSMQEVHDELGNWSTSYLPPNEWVRMERQLNRSGRPFYWTVVGANDLYGQMAICFYGRPQNAQTMDFLYQRAPRSLRLDGYDWYSSQDTDAVTITAEAGVTTFGGFGGSLAADVVGAVLRLGRTNSNISEPPGGVADRFSYSEQKIITARNANNTGGYVDSAWTFGAGTDGHFRITDPIDLPHYLLDCFFRGCERQLAILTLPDRLSAAEAMHRQSRLDARAHDAMVPTPQSNDGNAWKHPAWAFLGGSVTSYTMIDGNA